MQNPKFERFKKYFKRPGASIQEIVREPTAGGIVFCLCITLGRPDIRPVARQLIPDHRLSPLDRRDVRIDDRRRFAFGHVP